MVRLQFAFNPNYKGEFYEHFYSGRVRVVDGIVETDNQEFIGGLLRLGYVILDDTEQEAPAEVEEVVTPKAKPKTPPRLSNKRN